MIFFQIAISTGLWKSSCRDVHKTKPLPFQVPNSKKQSIKVQNTASCIQSFNTRKSQQQFKTDLCHYDTCKSFFQKETDFLALKMTGIIGMQKQQKSNTLMWGPGASSWWDQGSN